MGALDEIEAIKQLKARYFRLMDTKQWDAVATCSPRTRSSPRLPIRTRRSPGADIVRA
jgi:hypothetical protein